MHLIEEKASYTPHSTASSSTAVTVTVRFLTS